MACDFEILFNLRQYPNSTAVAADAFQLIADLEDQLTVYRPESEISRVNREAATGWLRVESGLFRLLETAKDLFEQTLGAFDITSASLTRLWQFDRRDGVVPGAEAIAQTLLSVGSQFMELDQESQRVRFANPALQINLGGIGKGYALDRVGEMIRQKGILNFAIHGGQSSVLAIGSGSADGEQTGAWWIGLSHPIIPDFRLGEVCLTNQALGTSGTGRQGFFHRGVRYGHIIDPRTGWPASHFSSTTVITESAAMSDALATAFFVMTLDDVAAYCATHPNVKVILVSEPDRKATGPSASTGPLLVRTFNFEGQELRLVADHEELLRKTN